jgi:peptidoglycan/LPS O-acetylase OafA/YrhL
MVAMGQHTMERLNGLDALRGFAALSVVSFHLTFFRFILAGTPIPSEFMATASVTRYGYLGVHVFFVISGFVITMTAIDTNTEKFIAARAARLLPLFFLCAALSLIAIAITGHREPSLSLYLANLTIAPEAFGHPFIDGVYWSLRCEVIFYVVILSLILWRRLPKLLFPLCLGWLVVCTLYGFGLLPSALRRVFVADYAPLFVIGIGIYLYRVEPGLRYAFLIGLATVIAILNELRHLKEIGDPTGVLYSPIVVSCVLASLPLVMITFVGARFSSIPRFCYWLGGMSYPLYLIHQEWGSAIIAMVNNTQVVATATAVITTISAAIGLSALDETVRPRVRRALYSLLTYRGLQ